MVKKINQYDAPNYTMHREVTGPAVLAAGASFQQFHFFQRVRIRAAHAVVHVAGTATETPSYSLRVDKFGPGGTTSIANLEYGVTTAQALLHATVTETVEANNGIRFTKSGTEAVGVLGPYLEYEVLSDAVQS